MEVASQLGTTYETELLTYSLTNLLTHSPIYYLNTYLLTQARFKRRATTVPN